MNEIKDGFKRNVGATSIERKGNKITIEHRGNMGARMVDVNDDLIVAGFSKVSELKRIFDVIKEAGGPDYLYRLILKVKK